MEQEDLPLCITIDQDFPEKASHCNMFFISLSGVPFRAATPIMGKKTPKAKAKPAPKKLKVENGR